MVTLVRFSCHHACVLSCHCHNVVSLWSHGLMPYKRAILLFCWFSLSSLSLYADQQWSLVTNGSKHITKLQNYLHGQWVCANVAHMWKQ